MAGGNILMGVVGRPHGVRGLLRVHSYTEDPTDLARYAPLLDDRGGTWTLAWRGEGVAELRDASGRAVADRGEAEKLVNLRLFAPRDRLPPVQDADEFYLADLIGLLAVDAQGGTIGRVTAVHDYGAGASLEVTDGAVTNTEAGSLDRARGPASRFVPFTREAVPHIDLPAGRMTILPPEEIEVQGELGGQATGQADPQANGHAA